MPVVVNNQSLRAFFSERDDVLKISRRTVSLCNASESKKKSLPFVVSVSPQTSGKACQCSLTCVIDDSTEACDLSLGKHWLVMSAPIMSGSTVVFDNKSQSLSLSLKGAYQRGCFSVSVFGPLLELFIYDSAISSWYRPIANMFYYIKNAKKEQ